MQVQVFKCTGYYFKYFYYGRNHDIMLKDYVPSKVFWTHVSHQLFNSSLLPRRYYFPILQRRYLVTKCLLFKCHQNIFKWSCFFNRVSLLTYTLVPNWDFPVAAEKQGDHSSGDTMTRMLRTAIMSAQMQNRAHSAKVTNFTKHLRMLEVCYKAYNLYKYLVQTPLHQNSLVCPALWCISYSKTLTCYLNLWRVASGSSLPIPASYVNKSRTNFL